jgi:hypothetical protein
LEGFTQDFVIQCVEHFETEITALARQLSRFFGRHDEMAAPTYQGMGMTSVSPSKAQSVPHPLLANDAHARTCSEHKSS